MSDNSEKIPIETSKIEHQQLEAPAWLSPEQHLHHSVIAEFKWLLMSVKEDFNMFSLAAITHCTFMYCTANALIPSCGRRIDCLACVMELRNTGEMLSLSLLVCFWRWQVALRCRTAGAKRTLVMADITLFSCTGTLAFEVSGVFRFWCV